MRSRVYKTPQSLVPLKLLVQPSKLQVAQANSHFCKSCVRNFLCCARNEHSGNLGFCVKAELRAQLQVMDRKRNQAALKGKKEVRAPPTQMSPRLAALRAPRSPLIKMRTPPSRASPRLAALKDSPLPLSPTSVLMPKKLLVLALAVPKPILPPVTPVQKDPETPIPEIPRVPKMRRIAWISIKPVWLQFPERVLAERGPSIAATKEKLSSMIAVTVKLVRGWKMITWN
ncbi:hypothetical protein PIB30_065818 [Stylosanthes scabra]|uniref:Uncharacterized protein n=1 Tax=Stylosanthes scabra TaxID=79078 RepID=A0ABU6WKI3_9FABA|nr:hypothetical protein [Stylosanthes scabra]